MSRQDELAIIGFAVKNREIHERLLTDLTQDHFTHGDTRQAFNIICELLSSGKNPTAQEVGRHFDDGTSFIAESWKAAGKVLSPEVSFKSVIRQFNRKQYANMAEMLMDYLMGDDFTEEGAEEIIVSFSPELNLEHNPDSMVEAKAASAMAFAALEENMKHPGEVTGERITYKDDRGGRSGFNQLEDSINGLEKGTLSVFAAQSGHGKTALAMNLTNIMSYHNNKRVYYLNTEMNITQMINRWIAMETQINFGRFNRGDITPSEKERADRWREKFDSTPILVSRVPGLTLKMVDGLVRYAVKKYGSLDCVVVDYIGRMDMDSKRNLQEWQIISKIAQGLKEIASDTGIPFITLAQLNNQGDLEGAKKIINDCDNLMYFKPKIEKVEVEGKTIEVKSNFDYIMEKQKVRNGDPSIPIRYEYDKSYQFIREVR